MTKLNEDSRWNREQQTVNEIEEETAENTIFLLSFDKLISHRAFVRVCVNL